MAYELEKLNDEERKKYGLQKPEGEIQLSRWVIDREREFSYT